MFSLVNGNRKVVGTVGELQFEVIQHRLQHEYNASCSFRSMSVFKACWITSDNKAQLENFVRIKAANIASDKDGHFVYLAESNWMLNTMIENNPDIEFHFTSEFKKKQKI